MVPSKTMKIFSLRSVHAGFPGFHPKLQRQGVKVLITSRCQLGCGLQGAEQLHLHSLQPEHAAGLLRQEAGATRATEPQAETLARICNHNALALTLIGGFIGSHAVTAEVQTCLLCVYSSVAASTNRVRGLSRHVGVRLLVP